MTVEQLINELKKYPKDMPIAVYDNIDWNNKDIPDAIQVQKRVRVQDDKPDFLYINLE